LTANLLLNVSNMAVRHNRYSQVLSQNFASEESFGVLEEDTEQIKEPFYLSQYAVYVALHYEFIDDKFLLVVSHHQAISGELSVRTILLLKFSLNVLEKYLMMAYNKKKLVAYKLVI